MFVASVPGYYIETGYPRPEWKGVLYNLFEVAIENPA